MKNPHTQIPTEHDILTVGDVMLELRCIRTKVYHLIESGQLIASNIGDGRRQYRILRSNLNKFLSDASAVISPNTKRSKSPATVKQFV